MIKYKNELSEIDTEQKAYFLGLIFSDGGISNYQNKHAFRISLIDKQLIIDLKACFSFLNYGEFNFGKYNNNHSMQYSLTKQSKELYYDLIKNGVLLKKSGENKDKVTFPLINKEFIHHFIRGYFDGDGSINIPTQRKNLRRIEICSASKDFLLQLHNIFIKNNINLKFREKFNNKSPLFVIEQWKISEVNKFHDFLYKDASIFLKRKKELFNNLVLIDKKTLNPICPFCNKYNVRKGGVRQMKNNIMKRYKCIECNKSFSKPI